MMTNVYDKSIELMDAHFESITDEDFMRGYLSVEEHQGTLIKDFLSRLVFIESNYDIQTEISGGLTSARTLNDFNMTYFIKGTVEYNKSSNNSLNTISPKSIRSEKYNSFHAANDDYTQLAA